MSRAHSTFLVLRGRKPVVRTYWR